MKPNRYTRVALQAARAGGRVLRAHFNKNIAVDYKGIVDPVTAADRSSQEMIKDILRRAFPTHTFIGEEDGQQSSCGEYCWIIDPLDGTVNFIHGLPMFSVSIGLVHRGELISGVVHAPLLGETYVAEKNKGAWLNGKRIHVSRTDRLVRSLVVTGFPYYVQQKPVQVAQSLVRVLGKVQGVRRLGSAALDLAYVAAGRFEAFWEEGLSPWDVAGGALLVQESGGKVTDYKGGPSFLFGRSLLASNGSLHTSMQRLIIKKTANR